MKDVTPDLQGSASDLELCLRPCLAADYKRCLQLARCLPKLEPQPRFMGSLLENLLTSLISKDLPETSPLRWDSASAVIRGRLMAISSANKKWMNQQLDAPWAGISFSLGQPPAQLCLPLVRQHGAEEGGSVRPSEFQAPHDPGNFSYYLQICLW